MTSKEKIKALAEKAKGQLYRERCATLDKVIALLDETCKTCGGSGHDPSRSITEPCPDCQSKEPAEKQESDVKSIRYRARLKKNNVAEVKQVTPDEIIDLCNRLEAANKEIERHKKFSI